MKITIQISESGTRSENIERDDAQSHVAAGGAYATEAQILLAFIEAEGEEVPHVLVDHDGDQWVLINQDDESFTYEHGNMKTHDEMSLESTPPKEGEVCEYTPKNFNEFFFKLRPLPESGYKCSFTEDFEDFWMTEDLESVDTI